MKKYFLAIALIAMSYGSFAAITITRNHGGANGYDKVTESHTGLIWKDHSLSCIDPGNSNCTWLVAPSSVYNPNNGNNYDVDVATIESLVREHISAGQLTGKMLDASGNVLTIWSATDIKNYRFVIDYNPIQ